MKIIGCILFIVFTYCQVCNAETFGWIGGMSDGSCSLRKDVSSNILGNIHILFIYLKPGNHDQELRTRNDLIYNKLTFHVLKENKESIDGIKLNIALMNKQVITPVIRKEPYGYTYYFFDPKEANTIMTELIYNRKLDIVVDNGREILPLSTSAGFMLTHKDFTDCVNGI